MSVNRVRVTTFTLVQLKQSLRMSDFDARGVWPQCFSTHRKTNSPNISMLGFLTHYPSSRLRGTVFDVVLVRSCEVITGFLRAPTGVTWTL